MEAATTKVFPTNTARTGDITQFSVITSSLDQDSAALTVDVIHALHGGTYQDLLVCYEHSRLIAHVCSDSLYVKHGGCLSRSDFTTGITVQTATPIWGCARIYLLIKRLCVIKIFATQCLKYVVNSLINPRL